MTIVIDEPRDRLLDAAEEKFRRHGFKRTTIDDITAAAGTGKGSLYLHFESKQEIYLAVVRCTLERFVARAAEVLQSTAPVPQRMQQLIRLTAEHYGKDELLHASLFGSDLVEGEVSRIAAAVQRERMIGLLEQALITGQREGVVRTNIEPAAAAAILFEIGWAIVRSELEGEAALRLEHALATLNEIIGLGLLPRQKIHE
ncbi:MAG: TetR/AcrR family transcriptional regulator [Micropepsaceae bacterium]